MHQSSLLITLLATLCCAAAQEVRPAYTPTLPALSLGGKIDLVAPGVVGRLVEEYSLAGPKMFARWWPKDKPLPEKVEVHFDDTLKAPAVTSAGRISISIQWMKEHGDDVGIMTHELMHIVQSYPKSHPGWLTEGIADYAREVVGSRQLSWRLPEKLSASNSYKDSYRVSAKFLVWLEAKFPGSVDQLHRSMQQGTYQEALFQEITKKTLPEVWKDCVADFASQH